MFVDFLRIFYKYILYVTMKLVFYAVEDGFWIYENLWLSNFVVYDMIILVAIT